MESDIQSEVPVDETLAKSVQSLSFGEALEAVKEGHKIAREGWNGKNMCVFLKMGNLSMPEGTTQEELVGGVPFMLFDKGPDGSVTRMPNLNMKAADGSTVTGWLASQTDMLAHDWCIIE